jgi:hypothetical protein
VASRTTATAPDPTNAASLMPRALLLTVGTGDALDLEASLFTPLMLSIATGEWARVVLLPSQFTGTSAHEVRNRLHAMAITVQPLAKAGAENDPDACFDHFDQAIEALLRKGFDSTDLVVDFTRGTKAMSAALVLAATRHAVPILRYVGGDRRDARGTVIAGSERIYETRTARATARRRLDVARDLVERANFAGALAVLPDPDHKLAAIGWDAAEQLVSRNLRPLIAWFAAWDRLDYTGARASRLPESSALPPAWRRYLPPPSVRELVARLDQWPRSSRLLAIDVFANACRRVPGPIRRRARTYI